MSLKLCDAIFEDKKDVGFVHVGGFGVVGGLGLVFFFFVPITLSNFFPNSN